MKSEGIKGRLRRRLRQKGRSKHQSEGPERRMGRKGRNGRRGIAGRDIGLLFLSHGRILASREEGSLPYSWLAFDRTIRI